MELLTQAQCNRSHYHRFVNRELDHLMQNPLPHITVDVDESDLYDWNVAFEVRLSILFAGSLLSLSQLASALRASAVFYSLDRGSPHSPTLW